LLETTVVVVQAATDRQMIAMRKRKIDFAIKSFEMAGKMDSGCIINITISTRNLQMPPAVVNEVLNCGRDCSGKPAARGPVGSRTCSGKPDPDFALTFAPLACLSGQGQSQGKRQGAALQQVLRKKDDIVVKRVRLLLPLCHCVTFLRKTTLGTTIDQGFLL